MTAGAWELSTVTAAILAGGKGTRLRGAVSDRPKVLADVNGRPFITYLLDQLAAAGVREVVLCTGYMADAMREALGESYGALRLTHSPEPSPLDTGGALRLAAPHLRSDPVLVLNGDSYCDVDLGAFVRSHAGLGGASIVVTEMPDVSRFGRVVLDDAEHVVRFEEKGAAAGPGWINAGVYLFGQDFLCELPATGPASLERTIFPAAAARGLLHAFRTRGAFIDIGTEATYRAAAAFFATRSSASR